jgi:ABC-type Zn uptake system ZnuABC Zn-binding protein ZnuA
VAKIGLRGQDTEVLKNTAKAARDAVIDLSRQANKEYEQALDALPKRLGRIPQEATAQAKSIIKIGGQKVALTKQGFKAYLTETLRDFGVKVNAKKAEFDFTESPLRVSEENILKEVFDVIQAWKDTSPKGLNRLAVKIGNYRKPGDQSDALNSIIGGLKNNIRKYIGKRVPAVKELNDRYMQREDFIDALRAELSIPNNIKTTEGIIKTSRKIEQLFNSNKELARELVEQLQGLQKFDILSAEAGRQLAQAPSRAQVTIGDSFRGFVQTVIPPRAIGEIAATTGIATQKIKPLITHLQNLSVPERIAVFSFFTDLFESLDESAGPDSNQ